MCDQGYDVLFQSKNCEIEYVATCEVVVEVVRKNNNVYVLKENTEKCYLRKFDDSQL